MSTRFRKMLKVCGTGLILGHAELCLCTMYLPKGKDATPLNIPFMPQSFSLPAM